MQISRERHVFVVGVGSVHVESDKIATSTSLEKKSAPKFPYQNHFKNVFALHIDLKHTTSDTILGFSMFSIPNATQLLMQCSSPFMLAQMHKHDHHPELYGSIFYTCIKNALQHKKMRCLREVLKVHVSVKHPNVCLKAYAIALLQHFEIIDGESLFSD